MITKPCCKCGADTIYPDGFHTRKGGKRAGELYPYCKLCHRSYMHSHYERNKDVYKEKARRNDERYRQEIYAWIFGYLKENPCVDCGEKDPVVLEFDHRPEFKKTAHVSTLLARGFSLPAVKGEIRKCDVRCANCHRRKTSRQMNFAKLEIFAKLALSSNGEDALLRTVK